MASATRPVASRFGEAWVGELRQPRDGLAAIAALRFARNDG